MNATNVTEDLNKTKSALLEKYPFLSSIVRACRVVLSDEDQSGCYAGITNDNRLVIYGKMWETLKPKQKVYILCHESMHIIFRHFERLGDRDVNCFNIAADITINDLLNEMLGDSGLPLYDSNLMSYRYSLNTRHKTAEAIYEMLVKNGFKDDDFTTDFLEGGCGGIIIQNGNEDLYKPNTDPSEINDTIKKIVANAYIIQTQRGDVAEGLQRLVNELLQPKIKWSLRLCNNISFNISNRITTSWRNIRRWDDKPNVKYLNNTKTIVLLDTSGSITPEVLTQALSEIYGLLKSKSKVRVLCFDADVYDAGLYTSAFDIKKIAEKLTGGGGTVIRPALLKTMEILKHNDAVVIFTDGEIFDLDNAETRQLLQDIKDKALYSGVVLLDNDKFTLDGWEVIKYNNL